MPWIAQLPNITVDISPLGRIPLCPMIEVDGFQRLGVNLYYSDHEGLDALALCGKLFGLDELDHHRGNCGEKAPVISVKEPSLKWMPLNPYFTHGIGTVPVHNRTLRSSMGMLETAWHVKKHGEILQALLESGSMVNTGKVTQLDMPIVKFAILLPAPRMNTRDGRVYICSHCNVEKPKKVCSFCKTHYCDEECQRAAYPIHKNVCEMIAKGMVSGGK